MLRRASLDPALDAALGDDPCCAKHGRTDGIQDSRFTSVAALPDRLLESSVGRNYILYSAKNTAQPPTALHVQKPHPDPQCDEQTLPPSVLCLSSNSRGICRLHKRAVVADPQMTPNESLGPAWGCAPTDHGRRDSAWGWLVIAPTH